MVVGDETRVDLAHACKKYCTNKQPIPQLHATNNDRPYNVKNFWAAVGHATCYRCSHKLCGDAEGLVRII